MEAQGERLLQDLVNQEKSLVGKVEAARAEAETIIEAARAEAGKTLEEARRKADELAAREAQGGAKEADAAREELVRSARDAASALEARARAHVGRAVDLVMEKVLP